MLFIEKNINKEIKKNNEKIDYESIKTMLEFIVQLKEIKEENPAKNVACIMNWVESYTNEIISILLMFSKLKKFDDNLYKKIENVIKENKK